MMNSFVNLKLSLLEANAETYTRLLQHCVDAKFLSHGKCIHEHMVISGHHRDATLSNRLQQMYIRCGAIDLARQVFDTVDAPSILAWTSMVAGYAHKGYLQEALTLLRQMELNGVKPDKDGIRCMVGLFSQAGELAMAKQLQERIATEGFSMDIALANSLITMFSKCRSLDDAKSVFDGMKTRNSVTWNLMVRAYAENELVTQAMELYEMFAAQATENLKPDYTTFTNLLDMLSSPEDLGKGMSLHTKAAELGFERSPSVALSLIGMYGRCGSIQDGRKVFDRLHKKDVVLWNAMIAAYAQSGHPLQALELFKSMESHYIQPDCTTFVSILFACEKLGVLEHAKMIHKYVLLFKQETHVLVATGILNMYSKCGRIYDAKLIFEQISMRDITSWNSMISAYVQHGRAEEAMELYKQMDVPPNEDTFLYILEACEHENWLGEGYYCFCSMLHAGIRPYSKHAVFVVSLLGKAEWLIKIEELIQILCLWNDVVVLKLLFNAYTTQGDVERSGHIANRIQLLEKLP